MSEHSCKHYNGDYTQCKAGVFYRDVTSDPDDKNGIAFRKPCVDWVAFDASRKTSPMTPGQKANWDRRGTCSKFEKPSEEEIAEEQAAIQNHLSKMELCFELIAKIKKEHKGESWHGSMECPACKGTLFIGIASINGHTRGHCKTEGCVSWLE